MQTSLSFLAHGRNQVRKLLMRVARYGKPYALAYTGLCCALLCASGHAYTVVQISTGAPQGTETQLLSQISAQFNAKITPNPLASNTYSVTIYGPNPTYLPPITSAQLLQQIDLDAQYIATVDTYTYVYGFADGESYNQRQTSSLVEEFEINCSTPIAGPAAWDVGTCIALTTAIDAVIFEESQSTPTIVPGDFR